MLKETIIMVQTYDLKVEINCHGCLKKIEKILTKIDGVYQTKVNRQQGKVTITGVMDIDIVFKKLKKGSMSAQLWDANSTVVSKHQNPQLGGSDKGDQLKDAGSKVLTQGSEANSSGDCGARSSGGTNDATMVLPQLTPTPEKHLPSIQEQIEQRLRMLNGEKLLPHQPMGMPATINTGGKQSGKKICEGTNANNGNKNDVGTKLYPDGGGNQVKNDAIGQPLNNFTLGSLNNHSQAKKDGVGSQMMGGSVAPQKGGMMRPTNNMIGPTSFPIMGKMNGMSMGPNSYLECYNMQPYGGSAIHGPGMPGSSLVGDGFYPRSAGSSGMEMMQQIARNPIPEQPYMMVQPQQEHKMMMNAHFPHSQNVNYGPGHTGYQLMGYDNGHEQLQKQYQPPMYYPMPPPLQHDNIFSDENPNICSLMQGEIHVCG